MKWGLARFKAGQGVGQGSGSRGVGFGQLGVMQGSWVGLMGKVARQRSRKIRQWLGAQIKVRKGLFDGLWKKRQWQSRVGVDGLLQGRWVGLWSWSQGRSLM